MKLLLFIILTILAVGEVMMVVDKIAAGSDAVEITKENTNVPTITV